MTGDFNEDMANSLNDLTKLMLDMELINIHAHKHGFDCDIATYIDGSHRLDYIFVSRQIVKHVICCGFKRFNMRLITDHRGYFLDLSIEGLFDRRLPILISPSERHIWGDNPGDI